MEIRKVWATIDKEGEYPYVDIFNNEEEAKEEIGENRGGLEIADVIEGYCIYGEDGYVLDESKDFYFTLEEAEEDFKKI